MHEKKIYKYKVPNIYYYINILYLNIIHSILYLCRICSQDKFKMKDKDGDKNNKLYEKVMDVLWGKSKIKKDKKHKKEKKQTKSNKKKEDKKGKTKDKKSKKKTKKSREKAKKKDTKKKKKNEKSSSKKKSKQ